MNEGISKNNDQEKVISELTSRIAALEKQIAVVPAPGGKKMMIFLMNGNMDTAFATFMVTNWAVAMGYEVGVYCTLWGLNLLRTKTDLHDNTLLEKTAKILMKKGPDKAILSQLHMFGIGTVFMKQLMKEHKFSSVKELIEAAMDIGVQFYACEVMMGLMGCRKDELYEKVQIIGGLDYMKKASEASINFFI